ncbi:MAG: hypothetical protein KJO55_04465 [Gammaproteobacteria bacterium]|nr:hypothetical protein [Gammaproteobacteria bacterium]NND58941.1 hypothetical protein [Gammaproteobacteria bacterium]
MHASTEQLLSLRDGAPVTAEVARHVADCTQCKASLEQSRALQRQLQQLPAVSAPANGWEGIAARLDDDAGALRTRRWLGLAAGVIAAFAVLVVINGARQPAQPVVEVPDAVASPATATDAEPVERLVARSQQLEQLLRQLDEASPRLMTASTANTIASLQDNIAMIDYGLTAAPDLSRDDSQQLWRQRIELMNTLVQVRGEQLQAYASQEL